MIAPSSALGIIVVNYGSSDLLSSNLRSVHEEVNDAVVIVVDNWSSRDEREAVSVLARAEGWTSILLDENRGFGGGVNAGGARAIDLGCRDLLLLNPDARIDARSIALLRKSLSVDRLAVASPTILTAEGRVWSAGTDLYLNDGSMKAWSRRDSKDDAVTLPWLSGACLMTTKETWEKMAGFDERYFLYWEDVDFSHRVIAAGGQLHLVDGADAVHDEGGTQGVAAGAVSKSPGYYYFNIRNRLLYASMHLGTHEMRKWRRTSLRAAYDILLRGGRRQLLKPVAPLTAVARGLLDGNWIVKQALRDRNA